MRDQLHMATVVADEARGRAGEEGSHRQRKPAKRADRTADGDEAVELWNRAVAEIGAQKVAAAELGISDSHLSDYCAGRRTVALHRVVLLCRKAGARQIDQRAALRILTDLALMAGLAPPSLPRKVTKPQVEKSITGKVRKVLALYSMVRGEVAADLGTTPEDVDAALDEQTNPRMVMP